MSESKDPAIKLFGKTIQLPEIQAPAADSRGVPPPQPPSSDDDGGLSEDPHTSPNSSRKAEAEDNKSNRVHEELDSEKDPLGEKVTDTKVDEGTQHFTSEDATDADATSMIDDDPKTPSVDNEDATLKPSKTEEEQSETSNSQDKTLKKPDKILPCPRCNSMDTKFCYYNNYNVNQPRHFCKNCQRYWTAGGTMRNVPVGAGRRKNKNSGSHYRQISVSEALQSARVDLPNGLHHSVVNANGTVLTFGSDSPICESMASVLKIAEKTMQKCSQNGFHKPEESRRPVSNGYGDKGEDHSSGSSVTAANSKDDSARMALQEPELQNVSNFPPQVPCFPPWPYQWNPAQWNSAAPMPAFCPPTGFPMPFYPPPPYWGCTIPGSWNVRWITPPPSSPNGAAPSTGPTSPTLGKHSRDENSAKSRTGEDELQKENNPEKCLWFPKTLRIDDPGEAAKSSIWATLGIKNDKDDSVGGGGSLFKAFRSKGDEKNHFSETRPVLQANPAALSRSLNFHENS